MLGARRIPLACLLAALLGAPAALGEHTRFWRESSYAELQKGTAKGVALRSDGTLVLAPKFTPLADPNVAYLWRLRMDSHGALYAAAGSNAQVLRFDSEGKPSKIFDSPELAAQALALDGQDNLYIGTSPDGKIYKVTPAGQRSVFFDPKTKYIWDLAVDADGIVYVATGDTGQVLAMTPDGKGDVWYRSDERHIRSLTFDGQGNLLLGTEPSGLIIRVEKKRGAAGKVPTAGRAFVLYETAGKEVTSLMADKDGNIYAAAVGQKVPTAPAGPGVAGGVPQVSVTFTATGQQVVTQVPAAPVVAPAMAFVPFPAVAGGSEVYELDRKGSPQVLWSSREDLVYSLGLAPDGRVLLGTGNRGVVIRLEEREVYSTLVRTAASQVTDLIAGKDGKIYLATANPGKVFALGPQMESEGSFESDAFDAKNFSHFGRLTWWGETGATDTHVAFYVRSGNTSDPEKNWSDWAGPYTNPQGSPVSCPAARFAQWKVVLRGAPADPPSISWVSLAYLPKNVAPEIDSIILQNPGVRVQGFANQPGAPGTAQPVQLRLPQPVQPGLPPGAAPQPAQPPTVTRFEAPPQGFAQRGYQGVVWSAHDDNEDELVYSLYIREEGEKIWRRLKDRIEQKYYSWDTTTMPDGAYYLKIVASDEASNPPDQALTAERISERFEIDNAPPVIEKLRATPSAEAGAVEVAFAAHDPSSVLARAAYSLDAGEWRILFPTGQLADSRAAEYVLELHGLADGEHTISVQVFDQFENTATAKVTFSVTGAASKH